MTKIVIAEDEELSRSILARAVKSLGYDCVEATDGRETWDLLQTQPDVSLLVTDMAMPEVDGYELVRRVREDERLGSLPIIMVSGIVTLREIEDVLKAGVSRFLPKPIDLDYFKDYITQLLSSK